MPLWETLLVVVIWLMAKRWLRWRRSVHAGRNYQRYSHSSPPIEAKQTLRELDPDKTLHHSVCHWCRTRLYVPLRRSRLEARPWRLTWTCEVCGNPTRVLVADDALDMLLAQDRAGGMAISKREVADFASVSVEQLLLAAEDEIL
jgi:RNase P subunit RPR2